jgi:hypothetical protein
MLNTLESRLENANSIQMKEKYETDIKKEIKKLQRHRDFFKQLIKDSEVKDKTRIAEYRRKIEDQMEKFRELEKEYKQKKLTKVVYQNHSELENKYIFDSSDEDAEANYDRFRQDYEDSDSDSESQGQEPPKMEEAEASHKEYVGVLLPEAAKKLVSAFESSLSALRANKNKLTAKKNKERI